MAADDFTDADLLASGDGGTVGDGRQFLHGTVERELNLAFAAALGRDAEIDVGHLTHAILDAEGPVVLQPTHLAEEHDEDGHENATRKESHQGQQRMVLYGTGEADTAPAYAKEEVDDVAHGEELQRATRVERVARTIAQVEVGVTTVGIANADEGHDHLNKEHARGKDGNAPIDTHLGRQGIVPRDDSFHSLQ